ncbi:methylated-DNA-protein-cysteine methyltransferase-like protein [Lewinella aquimaris]|uniref:Methylated-DNA-protein-cysteine methyltransferase-like protein n=1 Tax=Neolewinella aquimaris TaxID=1835722 RepID=A0A840E8B7_9BACT|nr:MGMT family protein [Neolewinella aquimaris]MBB4079962.1 methylated-DNA-protein-cysteine methyltransferase-like protein [Neolewinella aquimaris]
MAAHYIDDVRAVTKLIPPGRVSTYGAIADFLTLGSARMVGWALFRGVTVTDDIPAHRVVNRRGELSGRNHFSTPTLMQERLEEEGVTIRDSVVVDFDRVFWSPNELLT